MSVSNHVLSIANLRLPTMTRPRRRQPRPHRSSRSSTRARPACWKSSVRHWTRRRRRISLLVPPLTELCTTSAATASVFQPLFGGPIGDIHDPLRALGPPRLRRQRGAPRRGGGWSSRGHSVRGRPHRPRPRLPARRGVVRLVRHFIEQVRRTETEAVRGCMPCSGC